MRRCWGATLPPWSRRWGPRPAAVPAGPVELAGRRSSTPRWTSEAVSSPRPLARPRPKDTLAPARHFATGITDRIAPMTQSASANQLWFLDSLITIRVSMSDGQDGISILEHRMPHGSSPPLHIHRTEDEVFHILEGEFRVRLRDREQRFGAGEVFLAPKGLPHTYRVESAEGGRCLTIMVG